VESDLIEPVDIDLIAITRDCMEFASTTKIGATAKEHVFALLGQLVKFGRTSMQEQIRHIFRLAMHEL